ncbi:MAG TPA: polyprenyl synthetase family protein [Chthoniobacterales bacterium]|nr:polyprenyl synthetase family protein [Chthoniobacterales bacterium]
MQLQSQPPGEPADESPRLNSPIEWWFVQGRFATASGASHAFMVSLFRHSLEWRGLSAGNACSLLISVLDETAGHVQVRSQIDRATASFVARAVRLAPPAWLDGLALRAVMDEVAEYGWPRSVQIEENPAKLKSAPFRAIWRDFTFEQKDDTFLLGFVEPETGRRCRFTLRPSQSRIHLPDVAVANGGSMEYVSYTRLALTGTVDDAPVSGQAWFDHQWGSQGWLVAGQDKEQILGWDWLGIQLDDGRDLLAITHYDRRLDEVLCRYAVMVEANGQSELHRDLLMTRTQWWTSPTTGARYPIECQLEIPSLELRLNFSALMPNQEIPYIPPLRSVWEGAGRVEGTCAGRKLSGSARLELHGYAFITDLRVHLNEAVERIQQKIETFLPRQLRESDIDRLTGRGRGMYDPQAQTEMLAEPLWDLMDRSGKRWWPVFGPLMIAALGVDPRPYEVLTSVTAEMILEATTIIDDIQDNGRIRRGEQCTHLRYGMEVALNAGNTAYFLPMALLSDYPGLSDGQRLELYRLLTRLYLRGHIGQAQDVYWSKSLSIEHLRCWMADSIEPRLIQVYADKTGAFTEAAAEGACVIANADAATRTACVSFGRSLGLALQIVNDVADFSAARRGGNEAGSDLRAGKLSFVIYQALRTSPRRERQRLEEIFCSPALRENPVTLAEGTEIIRRSGALQASQQYAREMMEREWRALSRVLSPSEPKSMLRVLWTFVLTLGESAEAAEFAPA